MRILFRNLIILLLLALFLSGLSLPASGGEKNFGVSVFAYGGRWSENRFNEIIRFQSEFRDSWLWAVGASRTLRRFDERVLLEGELNLAGHAGRQEHQEVNWALSLRWRSFPWDEYLDTSLAQGFGLSHAFENPSIEEDRDRPAVRTQVFMVTELAFALPDNNGSAWEKLIRIHHRSGAFGFVSDGGSSNFITSGLRYRFDG